MIKRGGWAYWTTDADRDAAYDPVSERSAGLMLSPFRSRLDDAGPAVAGRSAGDESAVGASCLAHLADPSGVASIDFPAVIDLATLDGTNGFRINGVNAGDHSGWSVSDAGDVNGDGIDDIVIGAYGADVGGALNAGESYVVFGDAGGFAANLDLATLDGTNGFRLDGIDAYDNSGFSVSGAGDFNGDGFDDIIVGAVYGDPDGRQDAGESYVIYGHGGGFAASLDLASLDGTNGFRIEGIKGGDLSGVSVSSAGDVNGDGFDDVIIGAKKAGQISASYVVFGADSGFTDSLNLFTLDGTNGFSIAGFKFTDGYGATVSSAGDMNGDGFDDLIYGVYLAGKSGHARRGESYVIFGGDTFEAQVKPRTLDGTDGFRIVGVDPYGYFGNSVSSAGDINGDGFDDIIIGARQAYTRDDETGDPISAAGKSYVVFGSDAGFDARFDLEDLDGTNGFRLEGLDAYDQSGWSVSSAGDVNGDGFDDIIVGARGGDPGNRDQAGESYVVFGKAGGFGASVDLTTLDGGNGFRLDGSDGGDASGFSVSLAGDVNGDGFDDIIIGAPYADPAGGSSAGESYVVYGRAPTTAVTRTGSAANQIIRGGDFNDTLSGEGGNDRLGGGGGADTLDGGTGNDWVYYDTAQAEVRASLTSPATNTGDAAGDVFISIENLLGSDFSDKLTGDKFANRLRGEDGADTLSGFNGNDLLAGGAGHDSLKGGKGADSFTFGNLASTDSDIVGDFVTGVDRIAFDDKVFGFAEGALPAGSFVVGGTARDADDRVIYNSVNGNLFFDADGTGAQAQILIATLTGAPPLTASDIIVV